MSTVGAMATQKTGVIKRLRAKAFSAKITAAFCHSGFLMALSDAMVLVRVKMVPQRDK